jgi:cytochrome c-type biogenesis protein CcmE
MVATLVLNAFQSNLVFFFSPTQVAAGEAPKGKSFRIGGMVKEGSLQRSRRRHAALRRHRHRQGHDGGLQGNPARPLPRRQRRRRAGQELGDDGVFAATEVLAKHDENYMPPEAAKAVGDAHERAAANKAAAEAASKTHQAVTRTDTPMIPELGNFALILALCVALVQGTCR